MEEESNNKLPAVYISKDKPLKVLAKAYEEVSGLTNEFTLAYGGSMPRRKNVVSWGPIFPAKKISTRRTNTYPLILYAQCKDLAAAIADLVLSEDSFK